MRRWLVSCWDRHRVGEWFNEMRAFKDESEAIEYVKDCRPSWTRVFLYVTDDTGAITKIEGW